MEFRKIRGAAIGQDDAAKAAIVGFAHRRVDAHLGRHAGDEQCVDAAVAQDVFQVGTVERALAGLVDHRFAGQRIKLWNDVVTRLAANEDAAHRTVGADALFWIAAKDLKRRRIGQIGFVTFAGVDDQKAEAARRGEHRRAWPDRRPQPAHVIAERFAEAARLEKIALHVDDDQRGSFEIDRKRRRFGFDRHVWHARTPAAAVTFRCRIRASAAVRVGAAGRPGLPNNCAAEYSER